MNSPRQLRFLILGCLAGVLLPLVGSGFGPALQSRVPAHLPAHLEVALQRFGIAPVLGQTVQLLSGAGWLEVQRLRGEVSIQTSQARQAQVGDRLTKRGDRLQTASRSSTTLLLDNGIGQVQVSQNTELSVRQLGIARSGGWITVLNLEQGQVRFRIDKETMPRNSRFEVHSPSGVAGVRGTEFGVMLNSANRMVVGTEEGLVEAEAQGQTIAIEPEEGSAIFPNEPPLEPLPLDRELELDLEELDYRQGKLWVSGNIYPLNTIFVNGQELLVSKTGAFEEQLSFEPKEELVIRVANSVGDSQDYQLLGLGRDVE